MGMEGVPGGAFRGVVTRTADKKATERCREQGEAAVAGPGDIGRTGRRGPRR
ncbi:hypothetical protein GCM10023086_34640 [Streptomyces venetus]|uniref:Uncharacterized protein n=1 Tax=Streptomyces venetus TaxID=1701086 RepID=A0ABP8FYL1_9ACTN